MKHYYGPLYFQWVRFSIGDCKLLYGKQLKVFAFNLHLEYTTQAEKRLEKTFQKATFYLYISISSKHVCEIRRLLWFGRNLWGSRVPLPLHREMLINYSPNQH